MDIKNAWNTLVQLSVPELGAAEQALGTVSSLVFHDSHSLRAFGDNILVAMAAERLQSVSLVLDQGFFERPALIAPKALRGFRFMDEPLSGTARQWSEILTRKKRKISTAAVGQEFEIYFGHKLLLRFYPDPGAAPTPDTSPIREVQYFYNSSIEAPPLLT